MLLVPFVAIFGVLLGICAWVTLINLWHTLVDAFHYITSGFSLDSVHYFWDTTVIRRDDFGTFGYIVVGIIIQTLLWAGFSYFTACGAFLCIVFCVEASFYSLVNSSRSYTFKRVLLVIGIVLTIWGTVID